MGLRMVVVGMIGFFELVIFKNFDIDFGEISLDSTPMNFGKI